MPTTIYDSSLITKRAQAKTIAKSFLQRLNTNGTVNQTTSYGPQLGISSDSIINEVKNGTMNYIVKCNGTTNVNAGCCPAPTYAPPGPVGSFFIYLNCVMVTWELPKNSGKAGPVTYTIAATSTDGGQTVTGISTTNSYSFTTLTPLTHYSFTVTAQNAEGTSSPITSYSIYAPPLTTQSNSTSLELSPGYAWAAPATNSLTPYTFIKQTSGNYKCFGTLNEINLLYPLDILRTGSIFPLSELVAYTTIFSVAGVAAGQGVYKTTDGGLSWSSITAGKIYLSDFDFPDFSCWWNENEGVTVGDQNISPTGPDIYYTIDGGKTWLPSTVASGPTGFVAATAASYTYCRIGDTIWFCGVELTSPNRTWVYKSTDKGHTFTVAKASPTSLQINITPSISFIDDNYGVCGGGEFCSYTTDGGGTWIQRPEVFQTLGPIQNMWCINQNLVYVIANSYIEGVQQYTLYAVTNLFTASPTPIAYTTLTAIDSTVQTRFSDSQTGYARSNIQVGVIKKYLGTAVPSTPTQYVAYPGSSCVTFNIISNNFEFPTKSFTITPYDPAGNALAPQTFTNRVCKVSGLTNGTPYTFKFQASSPSATSQQGNFTAAIIPLSTLLPQPTSLVNAFFSNGATSSLAPIIRRLTLQFVKPYDDGGSPITSYTAVITQTNNVITTITGIPPTNPVYNYIMPTTISISSAKIYAVNSQGQATESYNELTSINYSTSRAPILTLISSATPGQYTINVQNSFSSGLLPLVYYRIYTIDAATFNIVTTCSPNSYTPVPASLFVNNQNITVTGLTAGTYYVYARNASSAGSTTILTITVT